MQPMLSLRCPNCRTLNPVHAKYCMECGNRLLICPNCGTVNFPFAKFCIECGTPVQEIQVEHAACATQLAEQQPEQATASKESTAPMPAITSTTDEMAEVTVGGAPEGTGTSTAETLLPSEERRIVTLMFADITGSTPLADRLDPEDMRAILTGYFNLMTQQIRKHGGTVEKYIGDAVMAVFGAPIAHEDDPDRAIRAALDMQAALAIFNEQRQAQDEGATRLQMRIGINTGEVAIPNNMYHQRQDFLVTGDAVNVAARLQQVASPDTILVGERTYLTTRDIFNFRAIAPLHLRGKADPFIAYVVDGESKNTSIIPQHPRGLSGRQVPLVGRTLELTLMHTNYARVQAERSPHLITILGSPGIGKSRLVREFIAREQEAAKSASSNNGLAVPKVLQGRCPAYGEGITYWPLVEILRSLLHVQERESSETLQQRFMEFVAETLARAQRTESAEEIATTILRSIGRGLSDRAGVSEGIYRERPKRDPQRSTHSSVTKQTGTQVALLRAWRVLLEGLAQVQPLIIILDDLQWADEALLDLLEYLTDRMTTVPILFLCPVRPDFFERRRGWGGGQRNFTTIELDALSREESSELVDELLNTKDLPEVLRQTILTRAEGNPFFVEEIIRMFIDQGLLVCQRDHEHNGFCWQLNNQGDFSLSELNTTAEPPDDTLSHMSYILPLPRVPDTVQGVLAARVDLLNPTDKLILQHAAIVGRTFWLSSLLELASNLPQTTVLEGLDSLIKRDFVVEEVERQARIPVDTGRIFSFKHILIRDVVYNNIPRMRRSQEHARLAFWLEERTKDKRAGVIELLAYHYQQALATWSSGITVHIDEDTADNTHTPVQLTRAELRRRAITYLTLAGDQALNSYYTLRALQAYREASELLTDQDDLCVHISMHEKLGDAYSQRSNLDEAWQEYRKALRLATSEQVEHSQENVSVNYINLLYLYERLAELSTRWLLTGFNTPPDLQEARSYIDTGLRLLESKPLSRERVAFLTYQAFWYVRLLEATTSAERVALAEHALESGHEALHLVEQLNNPSALSLTLNALGVIYTAYHKYKEAHNIQHRRQQLEDQLAEREELFDLHFSLGIAHEHIADYPAALMWFGRAWSNAQTMESPYLLLSNMTWRMRVWMQWNRWEEAHRVAQEILRLIEESQQDEKRQLWALETLATIEYRTGNQERGDGYTRQYKRLIDQQGERSYNEAIATQTTMHAIHLAREDWVHATADYKEKLRASEPLPSPEVVAILAELVVATGESAEVQHTLCERAVALAEESGARKSLAIALRARGRMYTEQQAWELAENDLCQSLRSCEMLDLPWERGYTLYHLAMLCKRRASTQEEAVKQKGDLSRARYHLEQALGFFEAMHAPPSIERVRLALMQDNKAPV